MVPSQEFLGGLEFSKYCRRYILKWLLNVLLSGLYPMLTKVDCIYAETIMLFIVVKVLHIPNTADD